MWEHRVAPCRVAEQDGDLKQGGRAVGGQAHGEVDERLVAWVVSASARVLRSSHCKRRRERVNERLDLGLRRLGWVTVHSQQVPPGLRAPGRGAG